MNFRLVTPKADLERLQAQQASAWIEVLQHASLSENAEFASWLKESPRNVRDLLFMLTVEKALNNIDAQRLHDTTELLARINRQVVAFPQQREQQPLPRVPSRHFRWVAAGIAAVLACGGAFLLQDRMRWQEYETAASEQRAFVLADGSVVHLNTRSRIAVRLTTADREVRLVEGEALFRVRHDPARPFRVYTDDARIDDVGTQFDVRSRPDGTVVAVLEGQVNVAALNQELPATGSTAQGLSQVRARTTNGDALHFHPVVASQEAQVSAVGAVTVRTLANVSNSVAWRERRLVFVQEPLSGIAEDFNRFNARRIRLEGPGVADRTYGGVFEADDTDSLLLVLGKDPDLDIENNGDEIVIRARGYVKPFP